MNRDQIARFRDVADQSEIPLTQLSVSDDDLSRWLTTLNDAPLQELSFPPESKGMMHKAMTRAIVRDRLDGPWMYRMTQVAATQLLLSSRLSEQKLSKELAGWAESIGNSGSPQTEFVRGLIVDRAWSLLISGAPSEIATTLSTDEVRENCLLALRVNGALCDSALLAGRYHTALSNARAFLENEATSEDLLLSMSRFKDSQSEAEGYRTARGLLVASIVQRLEIGANTREFLSLLRSKCDQFALLAPAGLLVEVLRKLQSNARDRSSTIPELSSALRRLYSALLIAADAERIGLIDAIKEYNNPTSVKAFVKVRFLTPNCH